MQSKTFNSLLLFSLVFMAHWFFGNLYEEIVLAPNNLTNSAEALKCWQAFFTISNPIYYYVPVTQIAVAVICFLYFKAKDQLEKQLLKRAAIFSVLSVVLTIIIVTQLNVKLFFGDLEKYKKDLYILSVIWLAANAFRLYLTGSALYFVFKTYILRKTGEAANSNRAVGIHKKTISLQMLL